MILNDFFEQQAKINPDNIALIFNNEQFTYQEIDQRANQLARFLLERGARRGERIGLLLAPSIEVYLAILGILKAGCAYVPIDHHYPRKRINYILSDCNIHSLLTTQLFAGQLESPTYQVICLDKEHNTISTYSQQPITHETAITPEDACYIIYTSGTTGKPKGVEITHQSVCNYVTGAKDVYKVTREDRVYQGFSIAFDASIEEIWLAFASGASLIIGHTDELRSGAGLVEFLTRHRVTVFSCVPTLLAMLDKDISTLRLLILGGEACPPDLVTRYSKPGLRILNTYGPTEATVVTTYLECKPDQPVSIGHPLPNCELYVLNSKLERVAPGEAGELFIGGACLARGYINQPELTKLKFIANPFKPNSRLYRSGDLAQILPNGDIQFMGRIDEQVKLRGFRVEVAEIENVLLEHPGVKLAVVAPQELVPGVKSLVAYLVMKTGENATDASLIQHLREYLPPYMIPHFFETVTELPILPSGKVDRHNLPLPKAKPAIMQEAIEPQTPREQEITKIWQELLQHPAISIQADFFRDLGGHSLLAAKTVSQLRKIPGMEQLSMVDLYANPTVKELAGKFHASKTSPDNENTFAHETTTASVDKLIKRHRLCGLAQALGCYVQFTLRSWQFLFIFLIANELILNYSMSLVQLISIFLLIAALFHPILFAIALTAKWLVLGRIKPGEYPLWGSYYLRWWFVVQLQRLLPLNYLIGSPLLNLYYRLMGAKIGRNCYIGANTIHAFDLFHMDDDSSIGYGTAALGFTVEQGLLKIGSIRIGKRCYIGTQAALGIHTSLHDDAELEDLSMLPNNATIPAGQVFTGSPARLEPQSVANPRKNQPLEKISLWREFGFGMLHYLALFLIMMIYTSASLPAIGALDYFYDQSQLLYAVLVAPLGAITYIGLIFILTPLAKKLVLGKLRAGTYKIKSIYYVRRWFVDRILETTGVETIYGTLFFPLWFRLLGARIGKRVEISTMRISPDLLTIEDESFIADLAFLGAQRVQRGCATFAPIKIGKRTFIGNSALIPPDAKLGDGCLLGCLSIPPTNKEAEQPNTSWFGSPAVFLPRREIFAGFSSQETYQPTPGLYVKRGIIDFLRIILPPTFIFVSLALQFVLAIFLIERFSFLVTALLFPVLDLIITLGAVGIVIGLKWLLIGRFRPIVRPAWSMFVWLNELITGLYEAVITHDLLEPFLGTPFMSYVLRLLGAKIGKRVYFGSTFFTEFDLVEIDDDAAVNALCIIQTHLFEDRVIKMSHLKIGKGCSVGSNAIVLYSSVMEENSILDNLSLLMKGETLPANSRWAGIPAQPQMTTYAEKALVEASTPSEVKVRSVTVSSFRTPTI